MSGTEGEEKLGKWLRELRSVVEETNEEWAAKIGINPSASVTTCKPSGTVSQLAGSVPSGIHPAFSRHYIRRIRQSLNDPLTSFLIDQGVPYEPCVMQPGSTVVFDFVVESAPEALTVADVGTLDQLKLAKCYGDNWATHTVSCTAYYTDDSWYDACSFIWENFSSIVGMSFLPYDGGSYKQAPYEEIDQADYDILKQAMPKIDWSKLPSYENGDTTLGAQTAACVGDACEL
jgi:ribonucleoside-diphosphate reductase alpha chain